MTFWDMTIYNDTLNRSDITPICEFITELDLNTDFDLITEFWRFHRTLQRARLANRGCLFLRTTGPVPFGTCICSNVETILSWTCHVYGPLSFEHPSVLLFCFLAKSNVDILSLLTQCSTCSWQNALYTTWTWVKRISTYTFRNNVCYGTFKTWSVGKSQLAFLIASLYHKAVGCKGRKRKISDAVTDKLPYTTDSLNKSYTKTPQKTFNCTAIMDRLWTVCWSDNSHTTSLVSLRFKGPNFQFPAMNVHIEKNKHLKYINKLP